MDEITDRFTEKFGPYMYGKIVEVPNKRKNVLYYIVIYDRTKSVDGIDSGDCCCRFPSTAAVKKMLKRAIARADLVDYRYNGNMNRRPKKSTPNPGSRTCDSTTVDENSTITVTATNVDEEGSVYLPGILNITRPNTTDNDNDNNSGGGESDSDEGSTCDMETSAFFDTRNAEANGEEPNLEKEDVDGDNEIDYMSTD